MVHGQQTLSLCSIGLCTHAQICHILQCTLLQSLYSVKLRHLSEECAYSVSFVFAELRFCYVALHSSREAAADARSSRGEAGRCA